MTDTATLPTAYPTDSVEEIGSADERLDFGSLNQRELQALVQTQILASSGQKPDDFTPEEAEGLILELALGKLEGKVTLETVQGRGGAIQFYAAPFGNKHIPLVFLPTAGLLSLLAAAGVKGVSPLEA